PTPTDTPTATPTPQRFGCIDGTKVDDLHVGLPGWEIHARPTGQNSPEYVQVTDGNGYFRFDNLEEGNWTVWEIMQDGWEPVTAPAFDVMVVPGQECTNVRFKNRQATPTPTLTPTPTDTPTLTPTPTREHHGLYFPLIMKYPNMCEIGRVQVMANGVFYSFSLKPDGNVKSIAPLPWKYPTDFNIVNYTSDVTWIQYQPYWTKQIGGYTFTYPGGFPGKEFSLFVWTDCGRLAIETEIDDPTPTPTPKVERH
ncbi:MAG: carboxypeptidase regulatory-like domain-containing protein, partial [Chloroflexi bacterium]